MDKNGLMIHLEDICFGYPGRPLVLDKLNLSFYEGERMGLMGSNGSGKTTLFHIIMGLLKPSSGRIEIMGRPAKEEKDFRGVRKRIGLLFQDADDQLFSPTVLEDVAFGPLNLGKSQDEAQEIATKTLASLGLIGFEGRVTHKLSGGEKRLVSLATVLAMEPDVLLLDEPTTGLDEATEDRLVDILKDLDVSYILVSHNMDFLKEVTTGIRCMSQGTIVLDDERIPHTHIHVHEHGRYAHEHGRK
jgi:cobalt/nickel transport system ATP-binding protein